MNTQETQKQSNPPSKCIWMEAGVVAYMLCDRNFACDDCPFDIVMRQRSQSQESTSEPVAVPVQTNETHSEGRSLLTELMRPLQSKEYPTDRFYAAGSVWLQPMEQGGTRIGVDALGAALVNPITGVVLPQEGTRTVAGEPFAWLLGSEGAIPLLAPVSGIVTQVNPALAEHPSTVVSEPYIAGWLAIVHSTEDRHALATAKAHREQAKQKLEHLRSQLQRHIQRGAQVGATMYDGGREVSSLSELVGAKTYLRLISTMFTR